MHISTKIKHLGYVKNYINSHNKNDQYTLNYNDYLDSTNVGPELFANIELRNTYQSENNFVSNIRNFSGLNILSLNIKQDKKYYTRNI